MKKTAIAVLLFLLMAGCSTKRLDIKHPAMITPEKVAQIKEGESRKEAVTAIFGTPQDIIRHRSGSESWFYKDFNLHSLYIDFNAEGVVDSLKSD